MAAEPLLDPKFPPDSERPSPSLWRNGAFQRVWAAATVSIFGSLVTRVALPFVAIVTLNAGAIEVSLVRSMDLIAGLAVGLVAGAWVDRLRRRPVLIGADLGRAALLGLIPLAAIGGWLSLPMVLVVALLTAVLTTFFDAADNAFLPTIVPRSDLVRANGALAASGSVSEFAAFGSAGFLVQILTAPIAILVDAATFIVSALLLGSIRIEGAAAASKAEREPVLREISIGLRLVMAHPILRATTLASMASHSAWGVFGALWFLFAIDELSLDAAAIGIIAAVGGLTSLAGAFVTPRLTRRFGVGNVVMGSLLVGALGFFFVPASPAGAPLVAMAVMIGQQFVTDPAFTAYDITDTSLRQTIVHDRQLGRVNATVRVAVLTVQLVATLGGGFIAVQIGLRNALLLGAIAGLLGVVAIYFSPLRRVRTFEELAPRGLGEQRLHEVVRRRTQAGRRPSRPRRRTRRARPSASSMAKAMPPRDVVSSLVSAMAGQPGGLVEGACAWLQPVLPGGGIEHEEHLGLRVRETLADGAADLGQLVHQVALGVQPPGGVDDDYVAAARRRGVQRVEDDR